MKVLRFATVAAMLICAGQPLCGAQWWQAYSERTGLVLSLRLIADGVEFYSPLQSHDPIPVSSWSLVDDTLSVACKSIGFKAVLTRKGNGWGGYWKQRLLREKVFFEPADTLFTLRRPQTPQQPYGFDEDTIVTDYTDSQGNTIHLEGSLSYPHSQEPGQRFPTLILVSGSGQQNRDEELLQHRPFLVLASHMASRGIAVLRYDDRNVGASTGPLDSADTRLFAEDAEAMLRAVKKNPHVDTSRLGIGGHSEGGAIAPMVAAHNGDVHFVVMLAGQGCTGIDVMVQQNEALFRACGVSERLCHVRGACMRELFLLPTSASVKDIQTVIQRHTAALDKAEADSIDLRQGMAYALRQQLDQRWMREFLALDPASYLPRVKCPLLAVGGSLDCQVLAADNLRRVKFLCPQADCRTFEGLNHLFQHCKKGSPDEYLFIEETFSEEVMKAVSDWVLGL